MTNSPGSDTFHDRPCVAGSRIAKSIPDSSRSVLEEKIRSMEEAVQSTLQIVRRILSALRPPLLDELGLKKRSNGKCRVLERVGIRYESMRGPLTRFLRRQRRPFFASSRNSDKCCAPCKSLSFKGFSCVRATLTL